MSLWVDRDNHIDIATRDSGDVAGGVDAADINIERISGGVDIGGIDMLDFGLYGDGVELAVIIHVEAFKNFGCEICERSLDKEGISLIAYDGSDSGG